MEKETKYYVWATDKCMSGWGCADGKICKRIWVCDTWEQMEEIFRNVTAKAKSEGYRYINYGFSKPRFASSRYLVCENDAAKAILFHDRIGSAFDRQKENN